MNDWAAQVLQGDRRALARVLTWVENAAAEGRAAWQALFPHAGRAHIVGVTGPPGAGKSTLVAALVQHWRQHHPQQRVAVLAVDPSSPYTGGALLGDRVRLTPRLAQDPAVFFRSMASRGAVGGLAQATEQAVQVLDAAGYNPIFVETVGAGQAEVDIMRLAHTVLVVQAPGLGDDIQAIKAGMLEIAHILVVNKADRPDAQRTRRILEEMLRLGPRRAAAWQPPVLLTVATTGQGVPQVAQAIVAHRQHLQRSGAWQQHEARRLQAALERALRDALWQRWRAQVEPGRYDAVLQALARRELTPDQAAAQLLDDTPTLPTPPPRGDAGSP